ncbi:hypothetical protein KDJ07_gp30 [Arthrobacter phage Urla]|uniref:Uncharacterized protein n=1 Tax=Arthrobacter phage Urla TaxID=2047867 RepID=A0A2H4P9C7_9CAUD|nr:hypothetical protein KDJ07_gp30 [Arthrobacter phage Urla]ATW58780.1 hypothetical protein PHIRE_URLA_30 [Arthrobacter phage Urla]
MVRSYTPVAKRPNYVPKGGAKSIRFTADYWAALRKQREDQRLNLLRRQVQAHLRFLSEDGKAPLYVFFGSSREHAHWAREFMLALLEVGVVFEPRHDVMAARPERMRGHNRRMVAVWSSDPTPVGERARQAEIDAMYYIEERNAIMGYEVSRETSSV